MKVIGLIIFVMGALAQAQDTSQAIPKPDEIKKKFDVELRVAGQASNFDLQFLTLSNDTRRWRDAEWSDIVQVFSQGPNPALRKRRRGMGFIAGKYSNTDKTDAGV